MGKFSHSGMGNRTYTDIEPSSTMNLSSMGNVTINGSIGAHTIVNFSGMGTLRINGVVEDNVKFIISGMGKVKFAHRPPQSVVDKIQHSGMVVISMPGGFSSNQNHDISVFANSVTYSGNSVVSVGNIVIGNSSSLRGNRSISSGDGQVRVTKNGVTTVYTGNSSSLTNGDLYIDGIIVSPNDSRIVSNGAASTSNRATNSNNNGSFSSFFSAPSLGSSDSGSASNAATSGNASLDAYSPATKAYLDHLKSTTNIKNSELLATLELSEEDNKKLEAYYDVITMEVVDTPVILDGRLYELDTLLKLQQTTKLDPSSRLPFTLRDIQPARNQAEGLKSAIQEIIESKQSLHALPRG